MGTIASTFNSTAVTSESSPTDMRIGVKGWKRIKQHLKKTFIEAVQQSNLIFLKACLNLGVDINVDIEDGDTALHLAAEKCDMPVLKYLLTSPKVDINRKNNTGLTPLMKACIFNCREVVQLLLRYGANPNSYSDDGNRPLHFACARSNMGIVFDLVQHGAIVNVRNVFDSTPLSISVTDHPSLPIAKYILKKGAYKHGNKEFPLLLECALCCNSLKRLHIFKMLVDRGMDIHQVHPIEKRNCLHYVAISSYLPLVNYILTLNVDSDLTVRDASGRTPPEIAVIHGNYTVYHLFRYYHYRILKERNNSVTTNDKNTNTSPNLTRTSSRIKVKVLQNNIIVVNI
ncbi:putative ankyrin repeat protein RF_0381 [Diorhabda sublineata]|uniref:putative ankyrin repeat protein RF_0381 n=1 Tax=Diorhabda sublineata TaxID=1163346 RepID=UPI0024E14C9E|nr:putative ankyrin repeat protein RF_0381 [Diorhabda sublineata]